MIKTTFDDDQAMDQALKVIAGISKSEIGPEQMLHAISDGREDDKAAILLMAGIVCTISRQCPDLSKSATLDTGLLHLIELRAQADTIRDLIVRLRSCSVHPGVISAMNEERNSIRVRMVQTARRVMAEAQQAVTISDVLGRRHAAATK